MLLFPLILMLFSFRWGTVIIEQKKVKSEGLTRLLRGQLCKLLVVEEHAEKREEEMRTRNLQRPDRNRGSRGKQNL